MFHFAIPLLLLSAIPGMCKIEKGRGKEIYSVCNTDECKSLADSYKKTLNFSVSPCDDFHEYVCGIVNAENPLDPGQAQNAALVKLTLDVSIKNLHLLWRPEVAIGQTPTDMARAFYQGCVQSAELDIETVKEKVIENLKKTGGIPLVSKSNYDPDVDYAERLARYIKYFGANAEFHVIIIFGISPDMTNTSANIPSFQQMGKFSAPLERSHLIDTGEDNAQLIEAYRNYIVKSFCLIMDCNEEEMNAVKAEAVKIVQFEVDLAKITVAPERRDFLKQYRKMTVNELTKKYSKIPWVKFANKVLKDANLELDKDTAISIMDEDYFEALGDLLEVTDEKTIANYIGWRVFQAVPVSNIEQLRNYIAEVNAFTTGVGNAAEPEGNCLQTIMEVFPLSVGKLYVESHFQTEIKKEVENIINHMRLALRAMFMENEWMDDATRTEALQKVEKMASNVAYPDWLTTDLSQLEKEEGLPTPFVASDFVDEFLRLKEYKVKKNLLEWNKPADRQHWEATPAMVNAFYDPSKNAVTLPAGILQAPFIRIGVPKSVNYGSIGAVVGHEIIHGFDNSGRQFDEIGNLRNWWTDKAKDEFTERLHCYIDQYSSIKDEQSGLQLNGELTAPENIADNGGLHAAFQGYLADEKEEERLPGLEDITGKQLLFISWGQTWCSNTRTEYLRSIILSDVHSPYQYRVYVPPENFPAFAEAFNCPAGSPMNPTKQCEMW